MKIVHVTNNYHPYKGGVVQAIDAVVSELQIKGHEVYIVTLNFLNDHSDDPEHVLRIPSLLRFIWKKNHMAIPNRATSNIKKIIDMISPDVVHIHHPFLLGPVALKYAKQKNIKTVFTYHTHYERYSHYVPFLSSFVKYLTRKLVNNFCTEVDTIIVPSTGVASLLSPDQQQKCVVLPSPIKRCFFNVSLKAKKNNRDSINLLSVSRFVKEKNIELLLKLMTLLPNNYYLKLVGYGHHLESLKVYAYTKLKLCKTRVIFVVDPPLEELLTIYQTSDIFLFSSKTDTQGLVLAEAMACGLPVVSINGFGQKDSIKEGYNGFIVDNLDQMKVKLIHIMPLLPALCINAKKVALVFHPETIVSSLLAIYRK